MNYDIGNSLGERSGGWQHFTICQDELRKTTKNISQDNHYSGLDSNSAFQEYESGALPLD
jgi:hypothetical protein